MNQEAVFPPEFIQIEASVFYSLQQENASQKSEISILKFQLAQLRRLVFSSKSERFAPEVHPSQLSLLDVPVREDLELKKKEIAPHTRTVVAQKTPPSRQLLPQNLLREITIIEPAEKQDDWKKIGEDISEQLEYKAAQLFVKQTIRPRYAQPGGEGIAQAQLPTVPIEKCIAGPSLLAQIVIEKYVDHIPLYRQIERYKRLGYAMNDSTLGGWIPSVCKLIEPLHELLKKQTLATNYLQVDETPHPVLDRTKKGTTHRGYFWVYHAVEENLVLYDYSKTRGREGPRELLKNFKGHLQTDGYAVYEEYEKHEGVTLAGCMAHARRYFEQALENDKPRAEFALKKMQELYAVERSLREEKNVLSEKDLQEKILLLRNEKSLPVLDELYAWMTENILQVLPRSPIGKAIAYSLGRWKKLSCYITNPKLNIDNNLVENIIRPSAVGRKNFLFAGSHEGAQRSAMLYSFMLTCKINDVNPYEWLTDVLQKINDTKQSQLHRLLPGNWKSAQNSELMG